MIGIMEPVEPVSRFIHNFILETHRTRVQQWVEQGVNSTTTHLVLQRLRGWTGSDSSVRRLVADLRKQILPDASCRIAFFSPGDAAQVDIGAGPMRMRSAG